VPANDEDACAQAKFIGAFQPRTPVVTPAAPSVTPSNATGQYKEEIILKTVAYHNIFKLIQRL
jgi:hypothetical protein